MTFLFFLDALIKLPKESQKSVGAKQCKGLKKEVTMTVQSYRFWFVRLLKSLLTGFSCRGGGEGGGERSVVGEGG